MADEAFWLKSATATLYNTSTADLYCLEVLEVPEILRLVVLVVPVDPQIPRAQQDRQVLYRPVDQ